MTEQTLHRLIAITVATLLLRISAAAKHSYSHPDKTASATQSLLTHAEKCIATTGGSFHPLLWNSTMYVCVCGT